MEPNVDVVEDAYVAARAGRDAWIIAKDALALRMFSAILVDKLGARREKPDLILVRFGEEDTTSKIRLLEASHADVDLGIESGAGVSIDGADAGDVILVDPAVWDAIAYRPGRSPE